MEKVKVGIIGCGRVAVRFQREESGEPAVLARLPSGADR